MVPPLVNISYEACRAECDRTKCFGFCFQIPETQPAAVEKCYIKNVSHFSPADLSNSNHCQGSSSPSNCPFNIYRTSGDIGTYWDRVLSDLASTVPLLGTPGTPPLSRPGAWAYPDMLEVGRLKNFSESKTHFGAWAVMSSTLILSFDLRVPAVMEAMWPIISNRDVIVDVIVVNERWAGSPSSRLAVTGAANGNASNSPLKRGPV